MSARRGMEVWEKFCVTLFPQLINFYTEMKDRHGPNHMYYARSFNDIKLPSGTRFQFHLMLLKPAISHTEDVIRVLYTLVAAAGVSPRQG